jgi:hypothetical protein
VDDRRLVAYFSDDSEDISPSGPAVNPASIVSDLESVIGASLNQVQVLSSVNFAQNNVTGLDFMLTKRFDRYQLAALDFSGHAVATRPKLNRFAACQLSYPCRGPSHLNLFLRSGKKMHDNDEQHGADGCGGKRIKPAAVACADFEFAENPAAKNGADEAKKNVGKAAIAAAARDFSGEPPGDEAEKNPTDETSVNDYAENLIHVSKE